MRAPVAPAAGLVLAAGLLAAPAGAQAPDRYGYAPPEAQVPLRRSLLAAPAPPAPAASALRSAAFAPRAAPPLRMLSWPGKSTPFATPALRPAPAAPAAPSLRSAALRPSRPAARARWSAPPRLAPAVAAPATPPPRAAAAVRVAAARPAGFGGGVAPPPGPTFAPAPAPADPVAGEAAARPVAGGLPPPRMPWYQRYPQAAAADPAPAPAPGPSGVGASLAPGTPAAPPPAAPLGAYAAPAAGAAPAPAVARAAPAEGGARYYSVHKPYGYTPDPDPIPPQFFGATADLTAPETPDPARATLTANAASAKAAVNAARLQQGAAD